MRQFVLGTCAAAALSLSAAWAATDFPPNTAPSGAHFANGASPPTCTVDSDSVDCTGTIISGVGNTNADAHVTVSASLNVQCRNGGGQIVEVKTTLQSSGDATVHTDVKNGTLTVDPISVGIPSTASLVQVAKCPNRNWTKEPLGSPTVTWTYTLTFKGFSAPAISLSS